MMRKIVPTLAALVGFAVLGAPFDGALGQGASGPSTTVVNPPTNPVNTIVRNPATMPALTSSIDDPGRVAYQSAQAFAVSNPIFQNALVASFPIVPLGHRLVVQRISGQVATSNPVLVEIGAGIQTVSGNSSSGQTLVTFFPPTQVPNGSTFASAFNEPVLFYVDAGSSPMVVFSPFLNTGIQSGFVNSLTGYLLDCTSSPCAPIAH
jgi:hypothetical protein